MSLVFDLENPCTIEENDGVVLRSVPKKEAPKTMRIVALFLVAVMLLVCLCLPSTRAKTMNAFGAQAGASGPVTTDIDDSDLFFQSIVRATGPQRDYSQKIEALLKRMTLEEK